MKKLIHLFYFISILSFSQKKENYYFDQVLKQSITDTNVQNNYTQFIFNNSKDNSYSLIINYSNQNNVAYLKDSNIDYLIKFDIDFEYKNSKDLEKLKNPYYFKRIEHSKPNKNIIEEIKVSKDSIKDEIIVHIKQFKNTKKKKIIDEHYYTFSKKSNLLDYRKNNFKEYLINNKNIVEIKDYNLEKSTYVLDDKIETVYLTLKIEKIDFTINLNSL